MPNLAALAVALITSLHRIATNNGRFSKYSFVRVIRALFLPFMYAGFPAVCKQASLHPSLAMAQVLKPDSVLGAKCMG